jgi:hypothetical protein
MDINVAEQFLWVVSTSRFANGANSSHKVTDLSVTVFVALTGRALPAEISSGTRFCYRPSKPQGLVLLEGLEKIHSSHQDSNPRPSGL